MKVGDLVKHVVTGKICIVLHVYYSDMISVTNFSRNQVFLQKEWILLSESR